MVEVTGVLIESIAKLSETLVGGHGGKLGGTFTIIVVDTSVEVTTSKFIGTTKSLPQDEVPEVKASRLADTDSICPDIFMVQLKLTNPK